MEAKELMVLMIFLPDFTSLEIFLSFCWDWYVGFSVSCLFCFCCRFFFLPCFVFVVVFVCFCFLHEQQNQIILHCIFFPIAGILADFALQATMFTAFLALDARR